MYPSLTRMLSSRPTTKIAYSNRTLRRHVLLGGMLLLALTIAWLVHRRSTAPVSVETTAPAALVSRAATNAGADDEAEFAADASVTTQAAGNGWAQAMSLPTSAAAVDLAKALSAASKQAKKGRLLAPPGDNALETYRSVLALDPNNLEAQRGIDDIVELLTEQARLALADGREFEVFELLPLLLALAPESEGVTSLRAHLEMLRQVEDLLVQAQTALRQGHELRPRRSSALRFFRDVLALNPGNHEATAGIDRIEARFLAEAVAAAEKGRFEAATEALSMAATVVKTSAARAAALAQIDAIRTSRQQALMNEANEAIALAQGALAQDRIERAEALGAPRSETQPLRSEVARIFQFSRFKPGESFFDLISSAGEQGPEMVVLPTGEFEMGSPAREKGRRNNEGPQHRIDFARGFAMARTEISVAQFGRFVRETGYITVAESEKSSALYDERGGRMVTRSGIDWRLDFAGKPAAVDAPVLHVAFADAQAYVAWLSKVTGQRYRLPSEAEFEYGLRAGSAGRFWWGEDSPSSAVENLTGEKDRSRFRRTWSESFAGYGDGFWGPAPVGTFSANPFGLKDLAGNVSEWVEDCWHESYVRAPADGSAWVNPGCDTRTVRGGSWGSAPLDVRSAYRAASKPNTRSARTGFRVARNLVGN